MVKIGASPAGRSMDLPPFPRSKARRRTYRAWNGRGQVGWKGWFRPKGPRGMKTKPKPGIGRAKSDGENLSVPIQERRHQANNSCKEWGFSAWFYCLVFKRLKELGKKSAGWNNRGFAAAETISLDIVHFQNHLKGVGGF